MRPWPHTPTHHHTHHMHACMHHHMTTTGPTLALHCTERCGCGSGCGCKPSRAHPPRNGAPATASGASGGCMTYVAQHVPAPRPLPLLCYCRRVERGATRRAIGAIGGGGACRCPHTGAPHTGAPHTTARKHRAPAPRRSREYRRVHHCYCCACVCVWKPATEWRFGQEVYTSCFGLPSGFFLFLIHVLLHHDNVYSMFSTIYAFS